MQPSETNPPTGDDLDPARRSERLERRLQAVHKVLNHDMPNLILVMQGLVQLLSLEENGRLSGEGQEYVRRLTGASGRAMDMVQGMKNLIRAGKDPERAEAIDLRELAAETAVEIKQLFPGTVIEYHFPVSVPRVSAGRRSLHQALVELLRLVVLNNTRVIVLGASEGPTVVELWIGAHPGTGEAAAWTSRAMETRLEVLLARELLERWDGGVRLLEGPGKFFAIVFPKTLLV